MDFLVPGKGEELIEDLFNRLNMPSSVVLEFGRHGTNLAAYILVANFLTRRIHHRYVSQMDRAAGKQGEEPQPLVITIEEAHKFLDPRVASDTIFGTIAREMRKYNVTLLIVDQRPSGIDDEVMSQIGTRVTCLLDNEADIRAVFSGVSGAGSCARCWLASTRVSKPWSWATPCRCRWSYARATTTRPSTSPWAWPTASRRRPVPSAAAKRYLAVSSQQPAISD